MCWFWSVGHEQCLQWDDALSTSALHATLNEEDCCLLLLFARREDAKPPQRFDCSKIT